MLFFARLVPALLAASSLVQAAAVARGDGGDFVSEFIDALKQKNLTILADSYEKICKTEEGKPVFKMLKEGGDITLLAPENRAFDSKNPTLDPNTLLYNAIYGDINKGFKSNVGALTRRQASETRSIASSGAGISGGGGRKRQGGAAYQAQVVDQTFASGTRKRMSGPSISIGQATGSGSIVDMFQFKHINILISDSVLKVPGKASDLLCQPLIPGAPGGFTKFGEALKKTGLSNDLDEGNLLTAFVPIDESFGYVDKLSKDDLTCLVKNHFLFGKRIFSPLFDRIGKATAASGKELKFSVENGIHYVGCCESKATVLRTDVIAGNGVLHVIDKPLMCD